MKSNGQLAAGIWSSSRAVYLCSLEVGGQKSWCTIAICGQFINSILCLSYHCSLGLGVDKAVVHWQFIDNWDQTPKEEGESKAWNSTIPFNLWRQLVDFSGTVPVRPLLRYTTYVHTYIQKVWVEEREANIIITITSSHIWIYHPIQSYHGIT